ncbi:MAG: NAD-dependent deacylase [Candidatus Omnitrophota bacterium]|jgi:NAD-dependent deacetylase
MIPEKAKDYIRDNFKKGRVACLTGAGISAESNIPTFRGKGGLWEKYDPKIYAHAQGLISLLRREPEKIADFLVDFYTVLLEARPNAGHLALAELEKKNILTGVITQNIDNLHQQAGSRNVIELHGSAFRIRCMRCGKTITLEKDRLRELVELLKIKRSRIGLLRILSRYFPRCGCGGRYRIDIVLFGEMLSEDELMRAYRELSECLTLLLIGTSLVVYPAAALPSHAKKLGAKLIEINNEVSALSYLCEYKIIGQASRILPEILNVSGYA